MRMIELLRKVHRKERESFVAGCYRELLAREPDPEGLQHHLRMLGGMSKLAIMTAMMQSPEADRLYRSGPVHVSRKRPSVAGLMRNAYAHSDERFVKEMYEELLCRRPDGKGSRHHVEQLRRGAPRAALVASLLQSGEAVELLRAESGSRIAQKILFDYANRTFYPNYHY